jgi:hypothetical protein
MSRKTISILIILTAFLVMEPFFVPWGLTVFATSFTGSRKPLVVVIINTTIYKSIEMSLDQYIQDVESEGFAVRIVQTDQLIEKTSTSIRNYLKEAFMRKLVGGFLVGDLPEAWYRIGEVIFPTDMYYRDLDGEWIDTNGDGVYEDHIGNTAPEIWIGRLKASTIAGNETSLINNYFLKNHRYRKGLRVLPWWRALAYIDDDGVEWAQDVNSSLSEVDTDITLVTDPATTNTQDYLSRIADPFGYQWVYLMCHGSFDYHTFMINDEPKGGTVYPHQYRDIDPRVFFYMLFVCSGARYTEKDYLAGTVVFTKSYGLLAIGATDTIYSVSFRKFFADLNRSEPIGTAFHEWFLEQDKWQNQIAEGEDYRYIFYGLTIIGDPTLKLDIRPSKVHDVSVMDTKTIVLNVSNTYSLIVTLNVKNLGGFDESFDVYLYQFGYKVTYAHVSLAAKSYKTLNLTIADPYRVFISNSSKTELTLATSLIPEEYNLGDNTNYLFLEGVAVFPPGPFQVNVWAAPIVMFSAGAVIAYGIFRVISSDSAIPSFVVKGKRYFVRKLSAITGRNRKKD